MFKVIAFLIAVMISTGVMAQKTKCMDIIPDKQEYIVSAKMLRKVIACFEQSRPVFKALKPTIAAIKQMDGSYVVPILGQGSLIIQQLNFPKKKFSYQLEVFANNGNKKLNKKFELNKKGVFVEKLSELRAFINGYAIVTISDYNLSQKPLLMVYAQ